jgi:hypothetical protein
MNNKQPEILTHGQEFQAAAAPVFAEDRFQNQ